MHKTRPAHDVAEVTEVIGRVRGKIAIVGDDVIVTGGTLIAGAEALLEAGATEVYVFATHGALLRQRARALAASKITRDRRHRHRADRPAQPARTTSTVLPVSGLLAETIMNVFADDSVSAIFGGENQLF